MARKTNSRSSQASNGHSPARSNSARTARDEATPITHQRARITQKYGTVVRMPNGLDPAGSLHLTKSLNQLLANTITLRDLYKKHHWQVVGHTFYQLHLLFDKHYEEQANLVDTIAERIQLLGGVSIAMAHDVAELTTIQRPPRDREEVPVQISRLMEAHELILKEVRDLADKADELGDDGTNDMLVSNVLRTNEFQMWFVSEHAVDAPSVRVD